MTRGRSRPAPGAWPPRGDGDSNRWAWQGWVVFGCALLLAPTLTFRLGVDQGVFAYMGDQILHGRWPYTGTWEADYPGLMFLQALEILVFGRSVVMFRVFDLLFQLGIALLIYRIAHRVAGRAAGILGAFTYCLIYQGYGPWNTAQREGFGLLFVLLGYWLLFTSDRRTAGRTAAGIGLSLGLATLIKPTLLAAAAFYLPLVRRLRGDGWKRLAIAAAGVALPAVVVIAFYTALGSLTALYEATVAYQPVYASRLRGDEPLLLAWLSNVPRLGAQTWFISVAYLPFLLFGEHVEERRMLYLGYLGTLAAIVVQGTFAGYHYLPGLGIGAVLLGHMFQTVCGWITRSSRWPARLRRVASPVLWAHVIVLAAIPFYMRADSLERLVTGRFLGPPQPGEFRNRTVFDYTESFEVARYLHTHTKPDDPVQVWGYESLVYYLADRTPPTRFQMTHPLVMRPPGGELSPMQRRWRREFIGDVTRDPPKYVAVVRQDDWWWAPEEKTSAELLEEDFPAFRDFIHERYRPETEIGRFLVYRRTDDREDATASAEAP